MLRVARQFDSRYFTNWSTDETACAIDFFDGLKRRCLGELDEEDMAYICSNEEERERFFQRYLALNVGLDANEPFKKLPQSKFRGEMFYCVVATWVMYSLMPQGFLPNLLAFQMNYLSAFAKKLDIELPPMPTRGAYKDRCMYYVRLNNLMWEYAELCGITQPEEVCAFWFDLALNVGKDEIENNKTPFPDTPGNAWLLVGNYTDTEQTMDLGYWQANPPHEAWRHHDILREVACQESQRHLAGNGGRHHRPLFPLFQLYLYRQEDADSRCSGHRLPRVQGERIL